MLSRNVLVLTAALMLSACGLSQQQQVDYDAVQHSKSSPAIYDKMVHGDPLSVSDIIELTRARVNDGIILRYIRDRETIYVLNGIDVDRMQRAGVSPSIIDYMLHTGQQASAGPGPYLLPLIPIGIGVGLHFH